MNPSAGLTNLDRQSVNPRTSHATMPNREFSFASEVFNLASQTSLPVAESIRLDTPIQFAGHTIVITHDLTAGVFPFSSTVRNAAGRVVGGGWHDTAEASLAAAKALAEA